MKTFAWISGIVAAILVIFAIIMWLFGVKPFLGVENTVEFIHSANTALLFTLVFLVCEKKE